MTERTYSDVRIEPGDVVAYAGPAVGEGGLLVDPSTEWIVIATYPSTEDPAGAIDAYALGDVIGHRPSVVAPASFFRVVRRALYADVDEPHVLAINDVGGWTLQHPLACRGAGVLFDCPFTTATSKWAARDHDCWPAPGHYVTRLDEAGELVVANPWTGR